MRSPLPVRRLYHGGHGGRGGKGGETQPQRVDPGATLLRHAKSPGAVLRRRMPSETLLQVQTHLFRMSRVQAPAMNAGAELPEATVHTVEGRSSTASAGEPALQLGPHVSAQPPTYC